MLIKEATAHRATQAALSKEQALDQERSALHETLRGLEVRLGVASREAGGAKAEATPVGSRISAPARPLQIAQEIPALLPPQKNMYMPKKNHE